MAPPSIFLGGVSVAVIIFKHTCQHTCQHVSAGHLQHHRQLEVAVEEAEQGPGEGGCQPPRGLVEEVVPRLQVVPELRLQLRGHLLRRAALRQSIIPFNFASSCIHYMAATSLITVRSTDRPETLLTSGSDSAQGVRCALSHHMDTGYRV